MLPYTLHEFKWSCSSPSFHIIIPTFLCKEFLAVIDGKKLEKPFFEDPVLFNEIKKLFDLLNEDNASEIRKLGIVNPILGYILESGKFIDRNDNIKIELVSKILLYINENFKNNISPSSIAEYFGYSLAYISHIFKTSSGITLKRYLTITKLNNVLSLIKSDKNNITYCALESGFTSTRTFYRSFKNEFGCSPKTYLKNIK